MSPSKSALPAKTPAAICHFPRISRGSKQKPVKSAVRRDVKRQSRSGLRRAGFEDSRIPGFGEEDSRILGFEDSRQDP
jgi:hypothetical protein